MSSRTQRGVPAAVGATTARASSRRRRSEASEQAAAAHDNRTGAGDRVVERRTTMADAKESGGRWWEGEGAAGFNFTEDNEGDNTDDYTSEGCDFVNRSVLRKFGRGIESYGTVVSWLPAHLNEGEPPHARGAFEEHAEAAFGDVWSRKRRALILLAHHTLRSRER